MHSDSDQRGSTLQAGPSDLRNAFLKRLGSFKELMAGVDDEGESPTHSAFPPPFNVASSSLDQTTAEEYGSSSLFDDWTNAIMNDDTVPEEELDGLARVVQGIAQFMENGPEIEDSDESGSDEDERSNPDSDGLGEAEEAGSDADEIDDTITGK